MTTTTRTADLLEPTPEEKKNGWTAQKLTAYVLGRETAQFQAIDPENRKLRPVSQNHRYNPLRWRG